MTSQIAANDSTRRLSRVSIWKLRRIPITPVLPVESGPMLDVLNNNPAAVGNRNQRARFDYAATAVKWNEKCMQELEKPKMYAGTGEARRPENVPEDGTIDRKVTREVVAEREPQEDLAAGSTLSGTCGSNCRRFPRW